MGRLRALLLLALVAAAAGQVDELAVMRLDASKVQPLSELPGCGGQTIDAAMDTCRLEDNIKIHDVHEYQFVVPTMEDAGTSFSLLLTAKSIGGLVEMYVLGPKKMFPYNPIFQLVGSIPGHTAMAEMFVRVNKQDLIPGLWRVRIISKSSDRKATVYSVRVQSPLTETRLIKSEKRALGELVKACCNVAKAVAMSASNPYLCSPTGALPQAAKEVTNENTDLCQIGPFLCTSEGRLQKMMLGGAGLSCPSFPQAFSAFEALHTMELEVASFGGDTYANAAKILEPLANLEFLYFRSTDLSGPLPCRLVDEKPYLRVLDISDTQASGQLPDCMVEHPAMEELFLTRTLLTGPIPDKIPFGSHLRILYSWNVDPNSGKVWRDGAFTGPLPKSLLNAQYLSDLVLPHHALAGAVPPLPDSVVWLDLKGNQLTKLPDALPLSVTVMDISDNKLASPLPDITDNTMIWANLSNNALTGPLPQDFGGSMDSLAVLDVSYNKLSGDLDATNWAMDGLEMLNLAHNAITGTIPGDIGSMKRLNYLNLAHNQISGDLEKFASALPAAPDSSP